MLSCFCHNEDGIRIMLLRLKMLYGCLNTVLNKHHIVQNNILLSNRNKNIQDSGINVKGVCV